MKNTLSTLLFSLIVFGATAQIGLNARLIANDADTWVVPSLDGSGEQSLLDDGYAFGIDYRIIIKDIRIELLPELNYGQYSKSLLNNTLTTEATFYSLLFNANIYFLDLEGDCTCPTWHKEGPTLQKGLYLQLSPGVHYFDGTITQTIGTLSDAAIGFSIGGGLGFDLGLTENITITPHATVRYFPSLEWQGLNEFLNPGGPELLEQTTSILQLGAGIRLGIHFRN